MALWGKKKKEGRKKQESKHFHIMSTEQSKVQIFIDGLYQVTSNTPLISFVDTKYWDFAWVLLPFLREEKRWHYRFSKFNESYPTKNCLVNFHLNRLPHWNRIDIPFLSFYLPYFTQSWRTEVERCQV